MPGRMTSAFLQRFLIFGVAREEGFEVGKEGREVPGDNCPSGFIKNIIVFMPEHVSKTPDGAPVVAWKDFFCRRTKLQRGFGNSC